MTRTETQSKRIIPMRTETGATGKVLSPWARNAIDARIPARVVYPSK